MKPLREACDHSRYEAHNFITPPGPSPYVIVNWGDGSEHCRGGRDVTDDDLRLLLDDLAKQEAARRQV